MSILTALTTEIRQCRVCEKHLPMGARPVFQLHDSAKILISGQAPGRKVHESGVPFNDASGNRLRNWLGLSTQQFYAESIVAILPMGFCYPGTGKSGDLPPRPECAKLWRAKALAQLGELKLILAIGQYAISYHLPKETGTLAAIVREQSMYDSDVIALPHPSPRNNIWLKRHPWFEEECIPILQQRVVEIIRQ